METNEIIQLAQKIKEKYSDDPIKICNELGIEINYMNLKPTVCPAYTLKVKTLPVINLNKNFTLKSQRVLCAHELGHALMHGDKLINEFDDNHNGIYEYEANLFAVTLLFNQEDLNFNIGSMNNYLLKGLLDCNIKTVTNEN